MNFEVNLLEVYRKKASVSVDQLISFFEPDAALYKLKWTLWTKLSQDPLFWHHEITPSIEEQKKITALRLKRLYETYVPLFLPPSTLNSSYKFKTRIMMALNEALATYCRCLSVKFALGISLFSNALVSLGTERHIPMGKAAWSGKVINGVALTEVAHGSNTKNLLTTATYDPKTKEFVLHTPSFKAAKCWIGNLGSCCTHCMVFAQLITADGLSQGLHGFITPIRDPKTMKPYPGLIVGDMGEKSGLNGIDNGFVLFDNYRIPKENLLNRAGDINDLGEYVTNFTDAKQILGAVLENLSAARMGICQESSNTLICAVTIAIRYGAVRQQFGPRDGKELSLIEYPTHQFRLFPYLAAACVFKVFIWDFTENYLTAVEEFYSTDEGKSTFNDLSQVAGEVHAVVSCSKPFMTWTCRDGIQECREACGGHAFLKASRMGELRNDHDPSLTYEGDNTVLIQQTSNWLIRQWKSKADSSELGTANFLKRRGQRLSYRGQKVDTFSFLQEAYEWLLCWLLEETNAHLESFGNTSTFQARMHAQVYRAKPLALIYAEYTALTFFWRRLSILKEESKVREVLSQVGIFYGLWCLDKHLPFFYQGGYASCPKLANSIREVIPKIGYSLLPEVVTIVDAIAPSDFALNSILGYADGKFYERLENVLLGEEQEKWWPKLSSKL